MESTEEKPKVSSVNDLSPTATSGEVASKRASPDPPKEESVETKVHIVKPDKSQLNEAVVSYITMSMQTRISDLESKVTTNMPKPFELRIDGKKMTMFLPANIDDHNRYLFRSLIRLAADSGVDFSSTDEIIDVTKETSSEKDFFYGFFKLLSRAPLEKEKITFNSDSISSKGAAQAKLCLMSTFLKGDYSIVLPFLPKSLFSESGMKILDLELSGISRGNKSNIANLASTLHRVVNRFIKSFRGQWETLVQKYKIPTSMLLAGMHRTRIVKVKGKDTSVPKKPKRPSKRVEVFLTSEVQLLSKRESAFDDYKTLVKNLGDSVKVQDIVNARKDIAKAIDDMWKCVESVSAILTKRRTAIMTGMDTKAKGFTFNKTLMTKCVAESFGHIRQNPEAMYTISPVPLLKKIGSSKTMIEISTIRFSKDGMTYPAELDDVDAIELLREFVAITEYAFTVQKVRRRGKHSEKMTLGEFVRDEVDEKLARLRTEGIGADSDDDKK
jgi:hypothetical protein